MTTGMIFPGPNDWRFDEIAKREPERARLLEEGTKPDVLIGQLADSIVAGIKGSARYGGDYHSVSGNPRIIIQIPIGLGLYDQFYNGRHGYRAHYWIAPETGNNFDATLVCLLQEAIKQHMPAKVEGSQITSETDAGPRQISREFALQSLVPDASKVWICERLIPGARGPLKWMLRFRPPKLIVEKWNASKDGLRAFSGQWLDFKGGFVNDSGRAKPSKDRNARAKQIHETGWT